MDAHHLIRKLQRSGYSIVADGSYLNISPDNVPPDLLQQLKQHKPAILQALHLEQQQEARRQKVLAMLASDPDRKRAIYADTKSDPDKVILAIAIRHMATFEMKVPKAKYDPWQLLTLIDKAGTSDVH